MKPERYMVTAVPSGGGERVTGCPVKYREKWHIWVEREDGTWNYVIEDPDTIEPVRLAPIAPGSRGYMCPSCGVYFAWAVRDGAEWYNTTPFCGNCGQALDWEAV